MDMECRDLSDPGTLVKIFFKKEKIGLAIFAKVC